ncbi:MAG: hypothetical protein IJ083_01865, partial [Clostridia bacterium]|nr:hypothetical protein [Clostridia bacterium]
MLGVFPLLSATYSGITRHKYLSMLLLTALTLVLFVEEKIREGKTGASRGKTRALIFPSVILGSLWFLWILLSCFFGTMADALNSSGQRAVFFGAVRYEGLISQSCYFLLFLLFALSKADVEKIIRFSAASLLVFSGIVVLQYLGQNPLDLYPKGRSMRSNYEFQGTIGNIDLVNGYLCLMIPLCLGLCLMKGARGNVLLLLAGFSGMVLECLMEVQSGQMAMLLYMAALLVAALMRPALRKRCFLQLSLFCLALTLRHLLYLPWLDDPMFRQQVTEAAELGQVYTSEAPAFGFHMKALPYIAACFAFAALAVVSHLHPGRAVRARWILGSGALLALAGFLLLWLYPWGEGSGAVWELHEILSGRGQDSFGSWRWGVWRHTLEMSGKSPLFGTGPDT